MLLDLLQLADSSFPTGSYAHSFGLETLSAEASFDLEAHVNHLLEQSLARLELPVVRLAFESESPTGLDPLMDVLLPASELRVASRSIGRSLLRAAAHVRPVSVVGEHHPVVFGAVLREWGLGLADGLQVYAFQAVRGQLSAAQRLGKIGQSAVQLGLDRVKPDIARAVSTSLGLGLDDLGAFTPLIDAAAMRHARQSARLFLS